MTRTIMLPITKHLPSIDALLKIMTLVKSDSACNVVNDTMKV